MVDLFSGYHTGLSIIQKSSLDNLFDKITVDSRGGFSHFHIPAEAAGPLLASLKEDLPEKGTGIHSGGLGFAERETLHNAFRFFSDILFDKPQPVPDEKLTVVDRKQIQLLYKFVNEYNTVQDKNLYVTRYLTKLGLSFVAFKSTALGQLLTDIKDGMDIKDALIRYNKFTDPRTYKRPVNLPSEKEFEASVEYLNTNGYTALLTRRMAVWDDLVASGRIEWVKPIDPANEPTDAFAALRQKVKTESKQTVEEQQVTTLPVEDISLYGFTGWLKEQLAKGKVKSIVYGGNTFGLGTPVAAAVEGTEVIYKDDKKVFDIFLSEHVRAYDARQLVNGPGWDVAKSTLTADGLLFVESTHGSTLPVLLLNNTGFNFKVPNLFSIDDLQDHLKPHFRTIYKYGESDILTHVDGKLMEYNNGVVYFVVGVSPTNAILITTTDNVVYTFTIKTDR
jgi:hypothetical protein